MAMASSMATSMTQSTRRCLVGRHPWTKSAISVESLICCLSGVRCPTAVSKKSSSSSFAPNAPLIRGSTSSLLSERRIKSLIPELYFSSHLQFSSTASSTATASASSTATASASSTATATATASSSPSATASSASSASDRIVDLHFSDHGGHIAVITLNRPLQLNSLSRQFMKELREVTDYLSRPQKSTFSQKNEERSAKGDKKNGSTTAGDGEETGGGGADVGEGNNVNRARVVLVRSSNPRKAFCAGADLKERRRMTESETRQFGMWLRDCMLALERLPQVTIACIDGPTLGGGLELALSCDFRVCSGDDFTFGSGNADADNGLPRKKSRAVIGLPECKLGIIPGAGGTQRLPRVIGVQNAKQLIFSGRRLKGYEAMKIGLVDFIDGQREEGNDGDDNGYGHLSLLPRIGAESGSGGSKDKGMTESVELSREQKMLKECQDTAKIANDMKQKYFPSNSYPYSFYLGQSESHSESGLSSSSSSQAHTAFTATSSSSDKIALVLAHQFLSVAPLSLKAAKLAIYKGMQVPEIAQSMKHELEGYDIILHSKDRKEGMNAFVEKRAPVYHGH